MIDQPESSQSYGSDTTNLKRESGAKTVKVSVIIPSYNAEGTIQSCLKSLLAQDTDETFEVIVIDSSDDGTAELIKTEFPSVSVFSLEAKTIPGLARNIGSEHARGEILAFTDSDCLVDKSWLRTIIENISNNSAHTVIGGSVENGRPESMISRAEFYIEFREFSSDSARREIRFLPSCNFAIRKEIFRSVGGFPDLRASEDTLFAHKLALRNHKILFDPDIKIRHLNRNQWGPYLRNQFILGKYAAMARKILPMPGGFFVKIPFAFPILPLVRTFRTVQFIFQNSFRKAVHHLADFLLVYPIFLLGSMVWSYGFFCGIRMKEDFTHLAEGPI